LIRIDRVELNDTGALVRAAQVSAVRDEPGLDRSTDPVSIQQAMHTPLMQSSEQVRHMVASQPRQQDMSQHAKSHPSPSLAM
jgi:hypothetical protein